MVDETAGAGAWIEAVPLAMVVVVAPPPRTCSKARIRIMLVALDEELNIINFIKSWHLIRRLCNVLYDETGRRCEKSSPITHPSTSGSLEKSVICVMVWVVGEISWDFFFFLMKDHFYLEERQGDKAWLFQLEHLVDIFLKMNEVRLSLQGKQRTVVVTNNKILNFRAKTRIWEKTVATTGSSLLPKA